MLPPGGHKAAHEHAHGAAEHVGADGQRGGLHAHAMHRLEDGRRKALHHRQRHGREEEEGKAPPDHRQFQEGQIGAGRGIGVTHHHLGAQAVPLPEQHGQHPHVEHRGGLVGGAPVGHGGDAHQEGRRQRPAQIAGQPVGAEGIAQPCGGHPLVEDGEVGRVKRRIAQPGQRGHQHQTAVAGGHRCRQRGQQKTADGGEQHRTCADAVHHKARHGLADAGDDKEDAHEQADIGIAQPEIPDEHRKQRRQQQMREMRGAVCQPDQADDGGVVLERHRIGRRDGTHGDGAHRAPPWGKHEAQQAPTRFIRARMRTENAEIMGWP